MIAPALNRDIVLCVTIEDSPEPFLCRGSFPTVDSLYDAVSRRAQRAQGGEHPPPVSNANLFFSARGRLIRLVDLDDLDADRSEFDLVLRLEPGARLPAPPPSPPRALVIPGRDDVRRIVPIVPRAPALREVLPNIQYDLFTVRPQELVRKATDELALGLHWYVLYTMVHSKALPRHISKVPVTFTGKNSPVFDPVVNAYHRQLGDVLYAVTVESPELLFQSMQLYTAERTSTKDLRSLLNHIFNLNRNGVRSMYYKDTVVGAIEPCRQCTRYFYHRNGVVPPPRSSWGDYTSNDPSSRGTFADREAAVCGLAMTSLNNLVGSIKDRMPGVAFEKNNSWVQDHCQALLTAALTHFASVVSIISKFNCLFLHDRPVVLTNAQRRAALETLRENTSSLLATDEAGREPGIRKLSAAGQFVLVSLWTRFGTRQPVLGADADPVSERESNERTWDSVPSTKNQNLRMATVKRFKLEYRRSNRMQISNNSFVASHASFGADPHGVTNLDVVNRVLDAANRCLRDLLIDAAARYDHAAPASDTFAVVMSRVMDNAGAKVLHPEELTPHGAVVYKESGDTRVCLFKEFVERMGLSDHPHRLEIFLAHDAHWADPRFLGEFLATLRDTNDLPLIEPRLTMLLVAIRDKASHNRHLHSPQSLRIVDVIDDTRDLLRLCRRVAELTNANIETFTSNTAIHELLVALPFYSRWRGRQHFLIEDCDLPSCVTIVTATVNGLMEACDNSALATVELTDDVYSMVTDGSPEALDALLSMVLQDPPNHPTDADSKTDRAATGPTGNAVTNLFAVLEETDDEA